MDTAQIYRELDGLTEDEVKARLAAGAFSPKKVPVVKLYLQERDLERKRLEKADELEVAKSATDAAWASAKAARWANAMAFVAIGISLLALWVSWSKH